MNAESRCSFFNDRNQMTKIMLVKMTLIEMQKKEVKMLCHHSFFPPCVFLVQHISETMSLALLHGDK